MDHMGIQTVRDGPYSVYSYSLTVREWSDSMAILIWSDFHTLLVLMKQKLG